MELARGVADEEPLPLSRDEVGGVPRHEARRGLVCVPYEPGARVSVSRFRRDRRRSVEELSTIRRDGSLGPRGGREAQPNERAFATHPPG